MIKKILQSAFIQNFLGYLFYLYTGLVCHTTRWTIKNWPKYLEEEKKSALVLFWHGRLFSATPISFIIKPKLNMYLLSSPHRDGRVLASTTKRYGATPIYGSSKKGGVKAAFEIKRALEGSSVVFVLPDGSKPGYKMTRGSVILAKETESAIILMSFATTRGKRLKSWDRCWIPFPFAKGLLIFSDPIIVPPTLDDEGVEFWRKKLEAMLTNLTIQADEELGVAGDPLLERQNV